MPGSHYAIFVLETTKDVKSRSVSAWPETVSLTRQRDNCWTDSKIESVQQLLNESERSFDQRRINRPITIIKHFCDA